MLGRTLLIAIALTMMAAMAMGRGPLDSNDVRRLVLCEEVFDEMPCYPFEDDPATTFVRLAEATAEENPRGYVSARTVSNNLCAQDACNRRTENDEGASDFFWAWGQFIDHDLVLTPEDEHEVLNIAVDQANDIFSYDLSIHRSLNIAPGNSTRQHQNVLTPHIDGSMVYGSDTIRAAALRGENGRMLVSDGNFLPYNYRAAVNGGEFLPNAGFSADPADLFLAGDIRANEHAALTFLHTLFVREHNRLADLLEEEGLDDADEIYEAARTLVIAQIQSITVNEFLPLLLGDRVWEYVLDSTPANFVGGSGIWNEFAAFAYRLGHTLVSCDLNRFDRFGYEERPTLSIVEGFFNPNILLDGDNFDTLARGLANSPAQELDLSISNPLRNMLFGNHQPGVDLASYNIERGRDHQFPGYNAMREALDLDTRRRFRDVSSDRDVREALEDTYDDVDDIDPWVGMLAEDNVRGSQLGLLGSTLIGRQFASLVNSDSCFHSELFEDCSSRLEDSIDEVTLADVIAANTNVDEDDDLLQPSAFIVGENGRSRTQNALLAELESEANSAGTLFSFVELVISMFVAIVFLG